MSDPALCATQHVLAIARYTRPIMAKHHKNSSISLINSIEILCRSSEVKGEVLDMSLVKRDNLTFAYEDSATDLPPMLLVHGLGLDHSSWRQQADFFRETHRMIAVDLRGHGRSDAPRQDYTMSLFADDLAWLCAEISIEKATVVGHSMGGVVALELTARHPEFVSSLIMIDSPILPTQTMLAALPDNRDELMASPEYLEAYKQTLMGMCLPSDHKSLQLISGLDIQQHVLSSALSNVLRYDASDAAIACRVPIAYIHSGMPLLDLAHFEFLTPQLMTARTLGSGHFPLVEVPEQIYAMICQFLKLR